MCMWRLGAVDQFVVVLLLCKLFSTSYPCAIKLFIIYVMVFFEFAAILSNKQSGSFGVPEGLKYCNFIDTWCDISSFSVVSVVHRPAENNAM